MKSLINYINEKLIVNKNYNSYTCVPKSFKELRNIIKDRYDKLGADTEQDPIDFNDVDISNIDSFYDKNKGGIFSRTKFKYIDISDWNVSNVKSMNNMFYMCEELESVGDLSKWDVSNVMSMRGMFSDCNKLKSVGDISSWDVSNVTDMGFMFKYCESFNQDISKWDVSSVTDMTYMFDRCKSFNQDISKWNVYNVKHHLYAFDKCSIKEEYKPKFK